VSDERRQRGRGRWNIRIETWERGAGYTPTSGSTSAAGGAASSVVSAEVAALTEGVLKAMFMSKLNCVAAVVVTLGLLAAGALVFRAQAGDGPETRDPPPKKAAPAEQAGRPATPADGAPEPDKGQADLREMRGTWTRTFTETGVTIDGKPQPPREKKETYVIADGKLIILGEDGLIDDEWKFTIDPTQSPKAIDLANRRLGAELGIYELKADTLKIGFFSKSGKRPTEFNPELMAVWELRRDSRTPAKVAPRFANEPGCFWLVEPSGGWITSATLGTVLVVEKDSDGAALITLAGALPGSQRPEYRPVLLDKGKNRYLPERLRVGGISSRRDGTVVALSRWRMDSKVLPADKVSAIGIEVLTPEYHRLAARAAVERARKEGAEVLPWPEVGQTYDFVLTTADGKKVRARDLRGKVVLIDCWATWCSPCVALLPELKELYENCHKDGLEVIGVSFDEDAAKFKAKCAQLGLPWPQVLVPPDEKTRNLWNEVTGISGVPRLLLIDRDGVLRADQPARLKEEVARLLQEKPGEKK
jgi:uncharacterized protein (TIGR03067 family)